MTIVGVIPVTVWVYLERFEALFKELVFPLVKVTLMVFAPTGSDELVILAW
jgi:hypothetical protein